MSTESPSRLMNLPGELRNLIFEILLIDPRGIIIGSSDEKTHNVKRRDMLYATVTPPPITRVSRQLRDETLQVFYSNTFKLCHYGPRRCYHYIPIAGATCWLYRMDAEQRAMVKDLRLCTWPTFEIPSTAVGGYIYETSHGPMTCWHRRTPRVYISREVKYDKLDNGSHYYRVIIEEPQGLASYRRGTRMLSDLERRAEMEPSDGRNSVPLWRSTVNGCLGLWIQPLFCQPWSMQPWLPYIPTTGSAGGWTGVLQ
ncbi:hypothetical protein LTR27_002968 [Elasticomyces elasticus]|nr:hypothetical protein LTR27_002968 [Elasticomyces elasticus]